MDWPVPILFLSDAPDQHSGLARITRDLCSILVSQPEWRVGSLGWLARGSSSLPWQQYAMSYGGFGERDLPDVWRDFARGKPGVIVTVWDLHRVLWLARPDFIEDSGLKAAIWGVRENAKVWSYVTFDATGPGDRLTGMAREALLGFDRLLAYTPWSEQVIRNTIGNAEADKRGLTWMPHGFDKRAFRPDVAVTSGVYSNSK